MTEFEIENLISDLKQTLTTLSNRNTITLEVPQATPMVRPSYPLTYASSYHNNLTPYPTSPPTSYYPTVPQVHSSNPQSTTWTINFPPAIPEIEAVRRAIRVLEHMKAGLRFVELPGG